MTAEASSPLAGRAADLVAIGTSTDGRVTVAEAPFLAQVDLRVAPEEAARLELPRTPNTVLVEGNRATLWLGPDEWLVTGPPGAAAGIVAELDDALAGIHRSVVDVSANRAVLDVVGPAALELLARGCSLDVHPRAWGPGRCAQTTLGKAQVILEQRTDGTRVFVRPSFSGYLVDWLTAAAAHG